MNTIHKYKLEITDDQLVDLPAGAIPLTVQMQHGTPKLWAMVNTNMYNRDTWKVFIVGTGNSLPKDIDGAKYLATFQKLQGQLVFHVFVKKEG